MAFEDEFVQESGVMNQFLNEKGPKGQKEFSQVPEDKILPQTEAHRSYWNLMSFLCLGTSARDLSDDT